MKITVFYEDAGTPNNYGPHMLVLECVAAYLGPPASAWALKRDILAAPKKGSGELKKALAVPGWYAGPVFALIDADRVRLLYGLPPAACKREVLDAIAKEAPLGPRVVLLEQNMEDVTRACCDALRRPHEGKPTPEERDRICHAAARLPSVREQLLERVPSLGRLVDGLCAAWPAVARGKAT